MASSSRKILIVSSHPNVGHSFNHQLIAAAKAALEADGHEVVVSDLIESGFNAVGGPHDFKKVQMGPRPPGQSGFHYQDEQKFTALSGDPEAGFCDEVKREMERVEWCDTIIHQFPIYWWSLPAVHKGWLDRILAYGWAYGTGPDGNGLKAFAGKQWMLAATIGGPTAMYLHGDAPFVGMSNLHGLMQATNYATPTMLGCNRVPMWFVGGVGRFTPEQKAATAEEYVAHLRCFVGHTLDEVAVPKPVYSMSVHDCDDDHSHGH